LNLPCDALAVSDEWGTEKPSSEFFKRLIDWVSATPDQIVYVGDHPANDLAPARDAGLKTAHLRRGPLGHYWAETPFAQADWNAKSLTELAAQLTSHAT
jgi:FMN phosphatase YigB (HAD superfamily)